jgi:hypothetical protein
MTALEKARARLKKKGIRFLEVYSQEYLIPAITLVYREEPCNCPYRVEEYEEKTGKHLSSGTGVDNRHYFKKPKEQKGYMLSQLLMELPEEKERALKDLFKWWNDNGGKLTLKQYESLGDILERLT